MKVLKPLHSFVNNFNSYSRKDRNAIILLAVLIVATILVTHFVELLYPKKQYDISGYQEFAEIPNKETYAGKELNLFSFDPNAITETAMDSLDIPFFIKNNIISYRKAGGKFCTPEDVRKIYGMNDSIYNIIEEFIQIKPISERKNAKPKVVINPNSGNFNPNTADSSKFVDFGFNTFQIKNLLKYRNAGGRFATPADILKIYGIDSAFYSFIKSHIYVPEINNIPSVKPGEDTDSKIELNSADSIDLIRLKGIGPVFANRILRYRNLLGGFYSVEQLLEVYNFPQETFIQNESKLSINPELINKIRINFSEYAELLKHPYLNKKDVESILIHRNTKGPFNNINDLYHSALIDSLTFVRVKSYLSCE